MGIDYTFNLLIGFEFDESEVEKTFIKSSKTQGKFHFEDRFDQKSGNKLNPIKVWDEKPKADRWLEFNGEKFDENFQEGFSEYLEELLDCNINITYNNTGDNKVTFSPNRISKRKKSAIDEGRVTVWEDSISLEEVMELNPKIASLKAKLINIGLKPEEAKIFISSSIG